MIRYSTFEAFVHNVCVLTSVHSTSTCIKIEKGKKNRGVNEVYLDYMYSFFFFSCSLLPRKEFFSARKLLGV